MLVSINQDCSQAKTGLLQRLKVQTLPNLTSPKAKLPYHLNQICNFDILFILECPQPIYMTKSSIANNRLDVVAP